MDSTIIFIIAVGCITGAAAVYTFKVSDTILITHDIRSQILG